MDWLGLIRGIIAALVGAFLILYAAFASVPNRGVLVGLGLVLMGTLTLSPMFGAPRKEHDD
jgi:uncharacterized membrane protein HdeD (DUF308 family)